MMHSHERVRGAACNALKHLALTLAPGKAGAAIEFVTGRLTCLPLLSRGHSLVVPIMAQVMQKDSSRYVRMCAAEALGTLAAPGDSIALEACRLAIKDREWLVAEAASTALAKLVNKGEHTLSLLKRREEASGAFRGAAAREEVLSADLTRIVKDNIDLQIARLRTFDLRWLVDLQTGKCHSWPVPKFVSSSVGSTVASGSQAVSRANSSASSSAASATSAFTAATAASTSSLADQLTPDKLAWAGFYYAPTLEKDDNCVCFICNASRCDWLSSDDPILFHEPLCVFRIQAHSDPELLRERILPVPPPAVPSSRKSAGRKSRASASTASTTVTWRVRPPPSLDARLSFSSLMTQALEVEEEVKDVVMNSGVVKSTELRLAADEAGALEAGQQAFTLMGHSSEDVASNGVLAFLSAFEGQGLHSRHTHVEAMHGNLVEALLDASLAPPKELRNRMDQVGGELVVQIASNDAAAAALMQHLRKRLHSLGPKQRHRIIRAIVRSAKGQTLRERSRERVTIHHHPYPSYFLQ